MSLKSDKVLDELSLTEDILQYVKVSLHVALLNPCYVYQKLAKLINNYWVCVVYSQRVSCKLQSPGLVYCVQP